MDEASATYAATLGAGGKWCIYPNQIPLANDVFAPSPRGPWSLRPNSAEALCFAAVETSTD